MNRDLYDLLGLLAAVCFVLALKGLSSPKSARRGNQVGAVDVLITTAAVPGRSAPQLVTTKMVAQMKPGSVVVDLAAETGGNVQGSKAGETIVTSNGVKIWGAKDVPSQLPFHASQLFARNVVNLLLLMSKAENGKPTGQLVPDFGDEIIAAATVTHEGKRR